MTQPVKPDTQGQIPGMREELEKDIALLEKFSGAEHE